MVHKGFHGERTPSDTQERCHVRQRCAYQPRAGPQRRPCGRQALRLVWLYVRMSMTGSCPSHRAARSTGSGHGHQGGRRVPGLVQHDGRDARLGAQRLEPRPSGPSWSSTSRAEMPGVFRSAAQAELAQCGLPWVTLSGRHIPYCSNREWLGQIFGSILGPRLGTIIPYLHGMESCPAPSSRGVAPAGRAPRAAHPGRLAATAARPHGRPAPCAATSTTPGQQAACLQRDPAVGARGLGWRPTTLLVTVDCEAPIRVVEVQVRWSGCRPGAFQGSAPWRGPTADGMDSQ